MMARVLEAGQVKELKGMGIHQETAVLVEGDGAAKVVGKGGLISAGGGEACAGGEGRGAGVWAGCGGWGVLMLRGGGGMGRIRTRWCMGWLRRRGSAEFIERPLSNAAGRGDSRHTSGLKPKVWEPIRPKAKALGYLKVLWCVEALGWKNGRAVRDKQVLRVAQNDNF